MLIGAPSIVVEFALQRHLGYQWSLAGFEICVIAVLFFIFGFGPERRGRDFAAE
jgi:cbb3-type cytochrome oxidase subunit 3